MNCVEPTIDDLVRRTLSRGKSLFLSGARQTGKTTLVNRLNPQFSLSFFNAGVRQRYERKPSFLCGEVETLAARSAGSLPLFITGV
jgi:predicted AAA+ superfamily ATPase